MLNQIEKFVTEISLRGYRRFYREAFERGNWFAFGAILSLTGAYLVWYAALVWTWKAVVHAELGYVLIMSVVTPILFYCGKALLLAWRER